MKNTPIISKITLIVIAVTILIISGCQNKQNPEPKTEQLQTGQESDKIPEQLENIENNIEKIIKTLNGPSVSVKEDKEKEGQDKASEEEKPEGQQDKQQSNEQGGQEDKQQSKEGEGKENGKDQEQNGEQKDKQNEENSQAGQNQAAAPKDPWQKISPVMSNLHYQWNSYSPSASKKNASRELIDKFSDSLNKLTSNILAKDKNNTLISANNLYAHVPDFYMLYRTETSPEIKRIRFYTRSAILNSMILNWDQAQLDINNLKSIWSLYKNTINQNNQDNSSKLDYSIYELEKVIMEKNQSLTDIKGRIAMSNIESLEKAMKENQGQGQGQGNENQGQSGGQSDSQSGSQSSQ